MLRVVVALLVVLSGCACSSFTHDYVDGGSAATFGGQPYLGVGSSVFVPIQAKDLPLAGPIESTNEPNLDPQARQLPGVAPSRAFVALRGDGTIVVFVASGSITGGRAVGRGVPELCPFINDPAADGCP